MVTHRCCWTHRAYRILHGIAALSLILWRTPHVWCVPRTRTLRDLHAFFLVLKAIIIKMALNARSVTVSIIWHLNIDIFIRGCLCRGQQSKALLFYIMPVDNSICREKWCHSNEFGRKGFSFGIIRFFQLFRFRFFLQEIQAGEALISSGDIEQGVTHLANAVVVCGQPTQLLQVSVLNA